MEYCPFNESVANSGSRSGSRSGTASWLCSARLPARRPLLNLWTGVEPEAFEFVEAHAAPGGQLRRYRIRYTDRIEHVQVGLTSDERMYWAWGL